MLPLFTFCVLIASGLALNIRDVTNTGFTHKPSFHFSPEKNWMSDPTGLVYDAGEYHMYFQHNPEGIGWGHMSWGHAVSTDLIHWKQLPTAISFENGTDGEENMIWSGSAVVDSTNSSGLMLTGQSNAPIVAFYTSHHQKSFNKTFTQWPHEQRMAVSYDKGRTFTKMPMPVIPTLKHDPDHINETKNFARDPKVMWHEPSKRWVMVLWDRWVGKEGGDSLYVILRSKDMKNWKKMQYVVMPGDYECPDLIPLHDPEGRPGENKYVLWSGGGTYLIGRFTGTYFMQDPGGVHHAEYGDGYASQTFSGAPDGRSIQMSWLGYFEDTCGRDKAFKNAPFTGHMSIPMELELAKISTGVTLRRQPVKEALSLRHAMVKNSTNFTMKLGEMIESKINESVGLEFMMKVHAPKDGDAMMGINLLGQVAVLEVKKDMHEAEFEHGSHSVTEKTKWRGILKSGSKRMLPLQADKDGIITIRGFVDGSALEFFDAYSGASMTLCSNLIDSRVVRMVSTSKTPVKVKALELYELKA